MTARPGHSTVSREDELSLGNGSALRNKMLSVSGALAPPSLRYDDLIGLEPGSKNANAVIRLQQRLIETMSMSGWEASQLKKGLGRFGPTTTQLVRRFQLSQGLEAKNTIDRATAARLTAPMDPTQVASVLMAQVRATLSSAPDRTAGQQALARLDQDLPGLEAEEQSALKVGDLSRQPRAQRTRFEAQARVMALQRVLARQRSGASSYPPVE